MAAAQLPRVSIERPPTVVGRSTVPAMQSGVFWGYVGLIEGLVRRIREERGEAMGVVATGGLAPLFAGGDRRHRQGRSRSDAVGASPDLPTQQQSMNDFPFPIRDPRPAATIRTRCSLLPLGGAGEIGMNLNLYGYRGQWLIVDCGVTFGDDTQPGLDVVMPDPAFIVERRDQLLGIVATHAHEDHIGAIPYLWPQLRCPVWATPFTASLLRAKLVEAGLADQVRINVVPMSGRFTIGPFDLELVTLTHSIPEPNAVVTPHRRPARCCTPATGSSTPSR